MDARLLYRVDFLDRFREFALARLAQPFALDRAADAHRQLVEDRIAPGCGLGQSLPRQQ